MVCPKCGNMVEDGAPFCASCGERVDNTIIPKDVRVRKQYKTSIYVILDLLAYGFLFGTNDFYAGFYKMGLFRLISTIVGFVLAGTVNLWFFFLPAISLIIGLFELYEVFDKAHMLENGKVAFVKPLDEIYDWEGTNNYLKLNYGCGLPEKKRKEYSTSVYVVLYFFAGGFCFGTNDFYAGYIKVGIFRAFLILSAYIMACAQLPVISNIISVIVLVIGVAELLFVNPRKYVLQNGNFALVRPLDIIFDKRGTEAMLNEKYGCGLQGGKRFDLGVK